jgi:Tfp pilus assembly protein PilF
LAGSTLVWYQLSAGQTNSPAHQKAPAKSSTARPLRTSVTGASSLLQTARNIGKAYYEQGKYAEAMSEFQKVIASGNALATDHLDLALALMQGGKLDDALGELTTAKQMDPRLTAAEYNLGILYKRELRYPDAEAALKRVIEADPNDPAVWFNLGTVYFAERHLEPALDAHGHVVKMGFGHGQNFYVASLFHSFTILTRLRRPAEAQQFLKLHEQFRDKVPNISLQNPALEGGKYGAILVPPAPATAPTAVAFARLSFTDITSGLGIKPASAGAKPLDGPLANFPPVIAVADYDSDGHPDLFMMAPGKGSYLYHGNADGTFTDVTEKAGLASAPATVSATFGDYDNCGFPSLFLAGPQGITVYHNNKNGTFTDVTEKAGLKRSQATSQVLLFDADNDGFLDLVATVYSDSGAASHLYRNNSDGTFRDITDSAGLAGVTGKVRGAIFSDFNNDAYIDLLFFREGAPPLLFLNQGEAKFVDRTAESGILKAQAEVTDAAAADFDHDGNFDLVVWSPHGGRVLLNDGGAKFHAVQDLPSAGLSSPGFRGAIADVNGDGFDDVITADGAGVRTALVNNGGHFKQEPLGPLPALKDTARIAPAWLRSPGKLDLLSLTQAGQFAAVERTGPPARWLEVNLDGYKSNKQGVGTVVELKAGNFYKKVEATGGPVRVYIGNLAKLDVVRVTWPNLVIQNSVDVATDKAMQVRESERLASSCPFLYLWDGSRYRFFTDILGVAPLGELSPDGSRIKPNPQELVRLGQIHQRDGYYQFQITDEMREVDYLDQLRLIAVDHPAAEDVYANEIYSSKPLPLAIYSVSERRSPLSAVDDSGRDVLQLIRAPDGRYPTDFRRNRILGLADLHSLTLGLGPLPPSSPLALYLTGWVFWTDSNGSRALESNSKLQMIPPYLQVRDQRGQWVTVIPDMGVPSGTDRTMRVDLTGKFLSADHHVRIVTNLCVYWDQIFFSIDDRPVPFTAELGAATSPSATSHELRLAIADLHYRGFSRPSTDPEHLRPDDFEYEQVLAEAPWNQFLGHYTRYGPVETLLHHGDDRLVVMATGDEMTAGFDARRLPPLKAGWKRDFFLYARGYAKDGEPNTAYFRTVEPLPFFEMSNYPYSADEEAPASSRRHDYLREYQNRPAHLLIPPLAPAIGAP